MRQAAQVKAALRTMIPKIGEIMVSRKTGKATLGFAARGRWGNSPTGKKSRDQPEQGWRGFFAWMTPRRPNRAVAMRLDRSNEG
jgi:hypothetical protein